MREVIIILIILISIISISNLTQKHLKDTGLELTSKLLELKTELNKLILKKEEETISSTKAKEISQQIYEKWEQLNKTWSIIVMHMELDQIELSILGVKASVEIGDLEEGREELEKSIFLIEHIKEKESFKLKNIF